MKKKMLATTLLTGLLAACSGNSASVTGVWIEPIPGMAKYIEYKNKTQEKCNYCTIYQCISGFYKKNVELHLLLILAIDSVIYSFYVTILLCKKAPVFD